MRTRKRARWKCPDNVLASRPYPVYSRRWKTHNNRCLFDWHFSWAPALQWNKPKSISGTHHPGTLDVFQCNEGHRSTLPSVLSPAFRHLEAQKFDCPRKPASTHQCNAALTHWVTPGEWRAFPEYVHPVFRNWTEIYLSFVTTEGRSCSLPPLGSLCSRLGKPSRGISAVTSPQRGCGRFIFYHKLPPRPAVFPPLSTNLSIAPINPIYRLCYVRVSQRMH